MRWRINFDVTSAYLFVRLLKFSNIAYVYNDSLGPAVQNLRCRQLTYR